MPILDPEYRTLKIGGFRVTVDPFLPVVLLLLAWLLSARYYPQLVYSPETWVYWVMGGISALILSISILIHEVGHAIAARWMKLELVRIHLFLFGGMAELKQRPIRPFEELIIAVAGPAASFLIAGASYLVMIQIEPYHSHIHLLAQFTFVMNLLLGMFNLLPIFPLDGGRALRAVIWSYQKRFHYASVLTFQSSSVFIALLFVATGVSVFMVSLNITMWIGLLALYLGYTALTGRNELVNKPRFSELIYRIDGEHKPTDVIEEIQAVGNSYVGKSIIPNIENQRMNGVIYGSDLTVTDLITDFTPYVRNPQTGDYIEINDYNTYHPALEFNAEYVPVFQNNIFLGLCDANEMRFWLLERKS